MKNKLVQSLRELFIEQSIQFVIPPYQRGYKWEKAHVLRLLDSIWEKRSVCQNTDQYFCLQNITLCASPNGWRVIDGQQRIITLILILAALVYRSRAEPIPEIKSKILFPSREKTAAFIEKIVSSPSEELDKADSLDEAYITDAVEAISEWCDNHHSLLSDFSLLFLDKVKLIVNLIQNSTTEDGQKATKEEKIFANLNGIKSEMDGSDLLRAIFITQCKTDVDTEKQLGEAFDDMNHWCKQETQQKFLARLVALHAFKETSIDALGKYHARITFNGKKYPIDLLYQLHFLLHRKNADQEFNYLYFESLLADKEKAKVILGEVRILYQTLKKWLGDRLIYHYLGYLIFNFNFKPVELFKVLYQKWEESEQSEKLFALYIQKWAGMKLLQEFQDAYTLEDLKAVCHSWYLGLEDDGRRNVLIHILILQDVLLCTQHPEVGFLPVDYFTKHNEDLEHIACQTPNPRDYNDHERWLLYADVLKEEWAQHTENDELRKAIETLEQTVLPEEANPLINKYGLNSAGNLVLLDSSQNRGYGNAGFASKQEQVIAAYFKNGNSPKRYIRPYTLKVFLTPHHQEGVLRWTLEDIQNTAAALFNNTFNWLEGNE